MEKTIYVPMAGETGSSVGPNGKLQTAKIRNYLKRNFANAEIKFSSNHYCCSAFLTFEIDLGVCNMKEKQSLYLSVSDYRFFPNQFYVRTAESVTDYTGGRNIFGNDLNDIANKINAALKEQTRHVKG